MNLKDLKQFTPIGSKVVLKAHKPREVHAGLVLPQDTMVFSPVATVIAKGPECKQVKEGDVVSFDPSIVLNLLHLPVSETEKQLFCVCDEAKLLVILDADAYAAQLPEGEDGYINQPLGNRGR